MDLTLTKTKHYELEPYGKFAIKFKTRQPNNPNIIPFDELDIMHDTTYPLTKEQEKAVVKLMKDNQTDILTDGSYFGFYTRTTNGLTMIRHKKLMMYREDEAFKIAVDDGYSFGKK
jgi:hypothetical protein